MEEAAGVRLACNAKLKCTVLKEGKCSAYEQRPVLCRLFGLVKKMKCPFGCVPLRWVSDAEAGEIMRAVLEVSGGSWETTW